MAEPDACFGQGREQTWSTTTCLLHRGRVQDMFPSVTLSAKLWRSPSIGPGPMQLTVSKANEGWFPQTFGPLLSHDQINGEKEEG